MEFEPKPGIWVPEGRRYDVHQVVRPVNMKIFSAATQVHGIDQAYQTEDMISMQMTDKDVVNPAYFGSILYQLHLGTLSAIYEKMAIFQIEQLAGLMPTVSRSRRVSSQYFETKLQIFILHRFPDQSRCSGRALFHS